MQKTIITTTLLAFILLCSNAIFSQQNQTWYQIKTPNLNQPFGYVWNYTNTPDESHKKCKGHEHIVTNKKAPLRKSPELKTTFVASSPTYKFSYTHDNKNQESTITYSLINENGTVIIDNEALIISSEKGWQTKTIDISSYQNQALTLVINIEGQAKNTSLFINLFQ